MREYKIKFSEIKKFELREVKDLMGLCGLYFIFLEKTKISYPFGQSRLIYIGMSEKKTNSIGKRLSDHITGQSGNVGIFNYHKVENLYFTYLNFEMLKGIWKHRIEDLESYVILDFVEKYGVYPICNNKTTFDIQNRNLDFTLEINWAFFE